MFGSLLADCACYPNMLRVLNLLRPWPFLSPPPPCDPLWKIPITQMQREALRNPEPGEEEEEEQLGVRETAM